MHKRWRVAPAEPGAPGLASALGVHPLVGQVLWHRGVRDAEAGRRFFQPKLTDLHDPALLPGVGRAAERIIQALRAGEPIAIYGDYDVDGVTATSILYHTLTTVAKDAKVRRYIPHRIDEGYGLNAEAIVKLAEAGVKLIVSVDCGITAIEQAAEAKRLGVDLIISDHHEMGDTLPDAYALVHPRLPDGANGDGEANVYPYGELCGAGVAYKLAWEVARRWVGNDRLPANLRELLVNLLSLAALGTVADVVPLKDENRTIVHYGLGRVKHTPFEGLNALIDAAKLREEKIGSYHVGFVLGPRLNACGRMGHAKQACKLLTTATGEEADSIAIFLNTENDKRRATEREMVEQACDMVKERGFDRDDVRAIVLGHEGWHAGVVGIVCSRLVDRYAKPTILVNLAEGEAHGSARSIPGFNLYEALGECAEHLETFGGHAMAAGLRLRAENLDAFREAMLAYAAQKLSAEDMVPLLHLEGEATLADLDPGVVEELEHLAPFGRDNPEPRFFVRGLELTQPAQPMGARGRHLSLMVRQGTRSVRCVAWQMGDLAPELPAGVVIDAAVTPKLNRWRGTVRAELHLEDLRIVG